MDGLMWDRCADVQTDIQMPRLKIKTGTEGSVWSVQLNGLYSLSPFPTLVLQITDLQSEHLMSVCVHVGG